jgi:hypothetical protein
MLHGFYRLRGHLFDLSIHHVGRLNYSLGVMWMAVIFSLSMLSHYISLPGFPACCSTDVPGLGVTPLDVLMTVRWYVIATLLFALNFAASIANFITLQSLLRPERRLSDNEIRNIRLQEARTDVISRQK